MSSNLADGVGRQLAQPRATLHEQSRLYNISISSSLIWVALASAYKLDLGGAGVGKNKVHYRGASTLEYGNPKQGFVSDSAFAHLKTKGLMKNQKAAKAAAKKAAAKKAAAKHVTKKVRSPPVRVRAWKKTPKSVRRPSMSNDDTDNELDQAVLEALKYTLAIHLCGSCRSALVSSKKVSAISDAYKIVADRRMATGAVQFKDDNIWEAIDHRLKLTPEECPVCYEEDEAFD